MLHARRPLHLVAPSICILANDPGGKIQHIPGRFKTEVVGQHAQVMLGAQALEGLRVILGVRPQTLATMVPKLLRGTLTSTNCKALGSLAEVAGPAIAPHLSNIFPPLLRLASQPQGSSPAAAAAKDALIKVSLCAVRCCS